MFNKRGSFFQRLTGGDFYDDEVSNVPVHDADSGEMSEMEEELEGQLTVDMYETPEAIIVEAMIAAVKPEDLDITITRQSVTIRGTREAKRNYDSDRFHFQELYWGNFSRTVDLPEEIEPENAEAKERGGLLTIILPKVNRDRVQKLKVKSH